MELPAVRSLVAIADTGSLTEAARRVHVTPAAIHRQIKVLEEELGVRLYQRAGAKLGLTQAGDALLPDCRALLDRAAVLLQTVEDWKGARTGALRVGASSSVSAYILPDLFRRFRSLHPGVDVVVHPGSNAVALAGLKSGDIDVAFLAAQDDPETNPIENRWPFDVVPVASPRLGIRRCSVHELAKHPFILYLRGMRMSASIERYFDALDFRPKVAMRFDHSESMKAMVGAGLGIAMLPYWTVDREVRQGRLVAVALKEQPLKMDLILVRSEATVAGRHVRAFCQLVAERGLGKVSFVRPGKRSLHKS